MCANGFEGCREYALLERVLGDQTADGILLEGKDVKPTSLQNPSDPDATYRKKAGEGHTGYVGNIVESCDREHGNIIDNYALEQNIHSDQAFAGEALEALGDAAKGAVVVADGGYQSEANFGAAEERGAVLVATNLAGSEPNRLLPGFEIEGRSILRCPAGNAPYSTKYNEKTATRSAYFEKKTCDGCQHREQCPAVEQRKRMAVRFSDTAYNRAIYAERLKTAEYRKLAKFRNGVEGVQSVLRRRYNVDSMPVFGLRASRLWFGFKIAAINATRLIGALRPKAPPTGEVCPSV
jgi:IS5 family transposase